MFRTLRKRIRPLFFLGAPLSWVSAALVQEVVRPTESESVFTYFGFVDWSPSFFYAFGFCCLFLGVRSKQPAQNALWVGSGAVAYEGLQYFIPERTVDMSDFVSSVAAVVLALSLYAAVRMRDTATVHVRAAR